MSLFHTHTFVRRLTAALVVGALACSLPPTAQAQMGSDQGPSMDQLIRALPDDLPNFTRKETKRWERAFAQATFERASGSGPAAIDVRLGYGRRTQAAVKNEFQKNGADTTSTADGRTVYTVSAEITGEKSADLLWTKGGYILWLSAKGASGNALDPAAAHESLRTLVVDHMPADQLPETEASAFPKPSIPAAKGFETPEGFSAITVQYGGGMDKAARISIAYPSDWTALDASEVRAFTKALDISRKESAAKARWYGSSGSNSDVMSLHAPDEVNVQVVGPGIVTSFVGRTTPMDCIEPDAIKSNVKNPTVVESKTKTTVASNEAATMTVEGTSADGYKVRQRVVCIASNGAVPRVTITRRTDKTVVSDDVLQTMVESLTAEVVSSEN